MKTKAKLTLAISVMSAAVLAAGVTSTFAWFTTQSKATFSTAKLVVDSVTDIKISVTKLGFTAQTETTANTAYTDTDARLGLVSSKDGLSFFAPASLASNANEYTSMAAVTTSDVWSGTNKHVGYMKYGIKVTADQESGAGRTLKVTLKDPVVNGANLTSAYRVAFGESVEGYATADTTVYSETAKSHKAWTATDTLDSTGITTTAFGANDIVPTITTKKTNAEGGITAYYILSVWAEGTDAEAGNDIGGDDITFKADFELV